MSDLYYSPSIFETYNARHLSPEKVAQSFVPPDEIYSKLATNNNHIITGPRGSGKTTLLKMLTLPALLSWDASQTQTVLPKVDFMGIFVPADRGWATQIKQYGQSSSSLAEAVGKAAFTSHVLMAFCTTLENFQQFEYFDTSSITHQPQKLEIAHATKFVELVSSEWGLTPRLPSLTGLKLALRSRLLALKSIATESNVKTKDALSYYYEKAPFASLDYREALKFGIEAYQAVTEQTHINWALLFDEFELAPKSIQEDVILRLRGEEASYLVHKLALAPFNETFMSSIASQDSSVRNDYEVIDLCYPRKMAALSFSESLFRKNLVERGLPDESSAKVLGPSSLTFPDDDDIHPYAEDGYVGRAYSSLKSIDKSFCTYLERRGIALSAWQDLDENSRAEIRKFRSIVITREYFRSKAKDSDPSRSLNKTSRKIDTLYTGAPTLLALCEGNPRILIGLISPLLRQLVIERSRSRKARVAQNYQAEQVRLSVNAFRALLKTVVSDNSDAHGQRGLLKLIDTIGRYFHRKCVVEEFSPQPHLTFTVPAHVNDETLQLLGRALNMGAIIYLPDKGADPILTSLKGKRFRLSYLLAAYHRLPIMLNTAVSLSTILKGVSNQQVNDESLGQVDLFEDYEPLND
jgi:hypothetical protein